MYPEDESSGELSVSEAEIAVSGLHLVTNEAVSRPINDSDSFAIDQMSQHRILTAAEEVVLAKRIERGDVAARQELMQNNYKLVISIAANYLGHGLTLLELVQEAVAEGLTTAVDKFDHRRGYKFSTYASWWIRHACQRAIYNKANAIRIPVQVGERRLKLSATAAAFEKENGREPTLEELAYLTNIKPEHIEEAQRAPQAEVSLNKKLGEGSDDGELIDVFRDETDVPETWDDEIDTEYRKDIIHGILKHMENSSEEGKMQARVLRLRFGIGHVGHKGQEPMTLDQVGLKLGIKRKKVHEIESLALLKLKEVPDFRETTRDDENFEHQSENIYEELLKRFKIDKLDGLTDRRTVVAYLMMQGKTNPEISARIGVGEGGVKHDINEIYNFLELNGSKVNRREACRSALERVFKSNQAA